MFSSVLGHNELGGLRMNISLSAYIPKSGKQVLLRNVRTKSTWLAGFNYITGRYHFQPVGNVKQLSVSLKVLACHANLNLRGQDK